MGIWELIITAVALSMDAFAVAICKGLSLDKVRPKHMAITGAWFGGFQGLMPLIGFLLGSLFAKQIEAFDHWIAFALLALIGANMIKEACEGDSCPADASFGFKTMLTMAIATSIDALAVGVSFAMIANADPNFSIAAAVISIGVITFILSAIGVKVGSIFGAKYKSKAELVGGIVLCLMGLKILLEHLGVIAF